MAQIARPISDKNISGSWTNELGGTTNLFQSIDEVTPNASDYITDGNNPSISDVYDTTFSSLSTPETGDHILRYRVGKDSTGGRQIDVHITLFNSDDTQIATWSHTNVDAITPFTQTLTSGQVDNINNYSGIYLRFNPESVGGGQARTGRIYWTEFEIPDAIVFPRRIIVIG